MKRVASTIFRFRVHLLILLGIITLFLGYEALQIQVSTDFSKMVPQGHEYIVDYRPFKEHFGGGNQIKVSVSRSQGKILNTDYLKMLKAFHGEGDGATAGNGVEAIIITKIPGHSDRFQVLNVTHRSKCSDSFIFRAFAFSTCVRAISDF